MIFAEMSLDEAEGAVLAYKVEAGKTSLRKGTLLTREHIAALRQAGVAQVLAARFEQGDIGEDAAAEALGTMLATNTISLSPPTAGRINLFASAKGIFRVDHASVDAINAHDARISLSTIHNHSRVESGQMIATIKIIPFAVPQSLLDEVPSLLGQSRALEVLPFQPSRIGLIQSRLPSIRESVLDKTRALMETRILRNGGKLIAENRVLHDVQALGQTIAELETLCDMIVIFSASAVTDIADIVPRAIMQAGGDILRIGVPVDPGNLLVLGKYRNKYIIAAPGSARSQRENSLDWILDRLMAGIELDQNALSHMGVGGLLL